MQWALERESLAERFLPKLLPTATLELLMMNQTYCGVNAEKVAVDLIANWVVPRSILGLRPCIGAKAILFCISLVLFQL